MLASTKALQTGHKGVTLGQGFCCGAGLWTDAEISALKNHFMHGKIYLRGIRDANKTNPLWR